MNRGVRIFWKGGQKNVLPLLPFGLAMALVFLTWVIFYFKRINLLDQNCHKSVSLQYLTTYLEEASDRQICRATLFEKHCIRGWVCHSLTKWHKREGGRDQAKCHVTFFLSFFNNIFTFWTVFGKKKYRNCWPGPD